MKNSFIYGVLFFALTASASSFASAAGATDLNSDLARLLDELITKPKAPESKKLEIFYSVQVASYPNPKEALEHVNHLKEDGLPTAAYQSATVKGNTWYRVYVGEFETAEIAKEFRMSRLKKDFGNDSLVVQRLKFPKDSKANQIASPAKTLLSPRVKDSAKANDRIPAEAK